MIIMATGHIRQRYGHYYYSFEVGKDKGKRHRVERYGGETKKEAESALRQALQEYENGGVTVELTDMSVADFFNYWFENYVVKNLKQNTQINYLNIINKYITPRIGLYKMKSIGPASLQQFMNDVSELGLSKHSVEIIQTVLRKGFKMAVFPDQLLKENPATYVQMPKYHEDVRKAQNNFHGSIQTDSRHYS